MTIPAWLQGWLQRLLQGRLQWFITQPESKTQGSGRANVTLTVIHKIEFSGPIQVELVFSQAKPKGPNPAGPPTFTCLSERILETMPTTKKYLTYQIDSSMDPQTRSREVGYFINDGVHQVQRFEQRIGAPTPITIEAEEGATVRGTILDYDDRGNPAELATPFEGVWEDKVGPQPAGAVVLKCVKQRDVEIPDPEPTTDPVPPVTPTEPESVPTEPPPTEPAPSNPVSVEPAPVEPASPEPTEPPIGE